MHRRASFLRVTAFLLGVAFALSACGKKGPLFIPDDAKPQPVSVPPAAGK
jgi:predicted small lipoprotein YifL